MSRREEEMNDLEEVYMALASALFSAYRLKETEPEIARAYATLHNQVCKTLAEPKRK